MERNQTDSDLRRDPDALLRRIKADEARTARAKLKIFFGFAPGVGKTYAMLESAQKLRAQGVDVVVGVVETHGRKETEALLGGLEVLPRVPVSYRGKVLEEFNLDSALKRKPGLILLDELAHTNAPGCRHVKRWQDVFELLDAGIDVYTTLNVQHIESLNDVVAQITRIHVRETVPDALLERADEIGLVDLPPDELLRRLQEGKVYVPAQARQATKHFFRRGNLLALRELALRRTADRVDVDIRAYREENAILETWPTTERILVCVSAAPASARLVRAARRMAAGLRAPWVAAYVESMSLAPLSREDRERRDSHLRLAESLGGQIVRLTGTKVSDAIVDYARRHNVTRILIGKPTHSRVRDMIRGSLLDEVVRGSGDIEVTAISGDGSSENDVHSIEKRTSRANVGFADYAWASGLIAAVTVLAMAAQMLFSLQDLEMLYLVGIVVVASRYGRGPSLFASALSVAAYDFFFVPPFHTFAVSEAQYILTFAVMLGSSVFISGMTLRLKRQESEARLREERTAALYAVSRDLGSAVDANQVATATVGHVADVFRSVAIVFLPIETGDLKQRAASSLSSTFDASEISIAKWTFEHGRPAGLGTDTLPGSRALYIPLKTSAAPEGVLAIVPSNQESFDSDQRAFLEAVSRQVAFALERARLADEARTAAIKARMEELRSSLLSAVSHDLRTPLAAITGAATTLRDDPTMGVQVRQDMLDTICEEADRLERLVTNLLEMTRLESGAIRVKREWVPLEELIGAALTRLETQFAQRKITTHIDKSFSLVPVDPVLIQHMFLNLFENAAKYTPEGSPIEISARPVNVGVEIDVRDHGAGFRNEEIPRVFDKFYRGAHAGIAGSGLGLAICRGIADAHGGSIVAENHPEGGAVFRILLPIVGEPPLTTDSSIEFNEREHV